MSEAGVIARNHPSLHSNAQWQFQYLTESRLNPRTTNCYKDEKFLQSIVSNLIFVYQIIEANLPLPISIWTTINGLGFKQFRFPLTFELHSNVSFPIRLACVRKGQSSGRRQEASGGFSKNFPTLSVRKRHARSAKSDLHLHRRCRYKCEPRPQDPHSMRQEHQLTATGIKDPCLASHHVGLRWSYFSGASSRMPSISGQSF